MEGQENHAKVKIVNEEIWLSHTQTSYLLRDSGAFVPSSHRPVQRSQSYSSHQNAGAFALTSPYRIFSQLFRAAVSSRFLHDTLSSRSHLYISAPHLDPSARFFVPPESAGHIDQRTQKISCHIYILIWIFTILHRFLPCLLHSSSPFRYHLTPHPKVLTHLPPYRLQILYNPKLRITEYQHLPWQKRKIIRLSPIPDLAK
jgi:hypothetical protein